MFPSGRSVQHSDSDHTSVEVWVSVSSTLEHQRCRNLCFWKFVSLHPIGKKEFHFRPESFLSIGEYASYYRLPLWRRVVRRYVELETLPYLDFRLHLNSSHVLSFDHSCRPTVCSSAWQILRALCRHRRGSPGAF